MIIELKKLKDEAKEPLHGSELAAGYDLYACIEQEVQVPPLQSVKVRTGVALNMATTEFNVVGLIFPRSGKGANEGLVLGNLTGVIDKDYQGEIIVSVWNRNPDVYRVIKPNDRIAQIVFIPHFIPTFEHVSHFSQSTDRGSNGFGSTN